MKYLVLLAGCGLGDGSCIEEVILTYVALDKYGCDYTPVAEDVSIQSVNHLTDGRKAEYSYRSSPHR